MTKLWRGIRIVLIEWGKYATVRTPNIYITTINQNIFAPQNGIWAELGFSTSPPAWNGITSIPTYAVWLLDNAGGRAMTGIVAIATLLYIFIVLYRKDKTKGRTKRQILTDKKVDIIYDKVMKGDTDSINWMR